MGTEHDGMGTMAALTKSHLGHWQISELEQMRRSNNSLNKKTVVVAGNQTGSAAGNKTVVK